MSNYSNNPDEHHLACLVMVTGGLDGPCDCGGRNRTKSPEAKKEEHDDEQT